MASTAPPITGAKVEIPSQYALAADLPQIPGVDLAKEPMEAFKLSVAKLVAQAWDEDVMKVYAGVDTGGSPVVSTSSSCEP